MGKSLQPFSWDEFKEKPAPDSQKDNESKQREGEKLENIARQFAKDFLANPSQFVSDYRKRFGNYLSSDKALELCQEYKLAEKERKAEVAEAIGSIAHDITRATFDEMLKEEPKAGQENMVMFVAGGAGSGKTSAIEGVQSVELLKEGCHIIYEVAGGLNEKNIQKTLDAGKWATVLYSHRPIEHAAGGVLTRAETEGRMPSFDYTCSSHFGCQKNFLDLCEKYKHHPTFSYLVSDNRRMNENPQLDFTDKGLDLVRNNAYKNIEEVETRAFQGVKDVIRRRESENEPINQLFIRKYLGSRASENETASSEIRADTERRAGNVDTERGAAEERKTQQQRQQR